MCHNLKCCIIFKNRNGDDNDYRVFASFVGGACKISNVCKIIVHDLCFRPRL
uniref:Uncharacterized protein n=1 Tax=Spodoptera exigua multiple nucleopolyhedrovirus TaxID=10454 RepID=A0A6N0C3M0_9ABAC|nr:hypothetical protein [Spodoptera exigua multiple nucleopolyhedrovirus]